MTDRCLCDEPLRDHQVGAVAFPDDDDEDDMCWRCRKPIVDEDDE